jgi:hypothetical protein
MEMSEMKQPNSNIQAPEKQQEPSANSLRVLLLMFEAWNFSGAWMLVLGAFCPYFFGAFSKC